MKDIRIWAKEFSLIIMFTGIFIKLVPQKSERKIMRFVTAMVIFTLVFQLNIGNLSSEFDMKIKENINSKTELINFEVSESIDKFTEKEILKVIENEASRFDEKAEIGLKISERKIVVLIKSDVLSSYDLIKIREQVENILNCKLTIKKVEKIE